MLTWANLPLQAILDFGSERMEEIQFLRDICEPIVRDGILSSSRITLSSFPDFEMERNVNNLCGWPKCNHKVEVNGIPEVPAFCSRKCQQLSDDFMHSMEKPVNAPIGPIKEKFPEMRPPKQIISFSPEDIEGHHHTVGQFRENLDEIELWIPDFPTDFRKMDESQEAIFKIAQEKLSKIDIQLEGSDVVDFYFSNLLIHHASAVTTAPEAFKAAFSYAIFEVMTGTDMTQYLAKASIPFQVYDELVDILGRIPDFRDR